jgi:hypothetical protein
MSLTLGILASASGDPRIVAIAHNSSPFVSGYSFNSGFGTKFANPATLPFASGYSVAFTEI